MTIMKPRPETRMPKHLVPEERHPLRQLHNRIRLAELEGDERELHALLQRAPVQYQAAYAVTGLLPRLLLADVESEADYSVCPGDVPSEELDSIEAEADADEQDVMAAATSDTEDASVNPAESQAATGGADRTPPVRVAPPAPLAWDGLDATRAAILAAARAEERAARRARAAEKRSQRLLAAAADAEAEATRAAEAATEAAQAVTSVLGVRRPGSAAARAAERYALLAQAQELAAAKRRDAAAARSRAERAQYTAVSRVQKTYLLIGRASTAYDAFVVQATHARSVHGTPRPESTRPGPTAADADDEGEVAVGGTTHPASPWLRDRVATFLEAPTVERVALLAEDELLTLATDWELRDRSQTYYVCDRRAPTPPWVRARELVILEGRWRARRGEVSSDFEERMCMIVSNHRPASRASRGKRARWPATDRGMRLGPAVRLMPVDLCGREPLSERDLLDELGGTQASGHQRNTMRHEVEAAVCAFYESARVLEPTDERAAALVLRMVARDQGFVAPDWMKELFAAHREALDETFHRPDHDRATDYGQGVDEDHATSGVRPRERISLETRAQVASLYVQGRIEEAARLAQRAPYELHQWKFGNWAFRSDCARAARRQALEMTG
jgi:hypothetical protein